jgi:hypothetical protein
MPNHGSVDVQLLFCVDSYLLWIFRDDLRQPCICRELAADANPLPFVFVFRHSELAPIVSPDHDSENLIRVRLVEIQECWLSLR